MDSPGFFSAAGNRGVDRSAQRGPVIPFSPSCDLPRYQFRPELEDRLSHR